MPLLSQGLLPSRGVGDMVRASAPTATTPAAKAKSRLLSGAKAQCALPELELSLFIFGRIDHHHPTLISFSLLDKASKALIIPLLIVIFPLAWVFFLSPSFEVSSYDGYGVMKVQCLIAFFMRGFFIQLDLCSSPSQPAASRERRDFHHDTV